MSRGLGVWVLASLLLAHGPALREVSAAESFPHIHSQPPIAGNPAADPTLPPRFGSPGRLLLTCEATSASLGWSLYASARDFDEGRQSFFLKRTDAAGSEILYPLHGHFLDGGATGIFMVHDGKGTKAGDAFHIDQSVNMGVLFLKGTGSDLRAIVDVFAEEKASDPASAPGRPLPDYACRWVEGDHPLSAQATNVRTQPNSGATPPSHWYRESDRTLLTCQADSSQGEYRLKLLGSTIWPGHLGFLEVHSPGGRPVVGYNVHLLTTGDRLLIHAHSYPHRTRAHSFDTMEETETVIGGLLLVKTAGGYTGWAGLAGSSADPYNISFSRDATIADYASMGHAVIPPLPVTCK